MSRGFIQEPIFEQKVTEKTENNTVSALFPPYPPVHFRWLRLHRARFFLSSKNPGSQSRQLDSNQDNCFHDLLRWSNRARAPFFWH